MNLLTMASAVANKQASKQTCIDLHMCTMLCGAHSGSPRLLSLCAHALHVQCPIKLSIVTCFFYSLLLSIQVLSVESFVATEICRLRWNWLYLILVSPLIISYNSIMSSFHQFVTNPTAQQLNGTEMEDKVKFL